MQTKESRTVVKSDLLLTGEVYKYIKKLEEIKTYLIYAVTGQVEKNDQEALKHLLDLNHIQLDMNDLHSNLKDELIIFNGEKAWGKHE